MIRLDLIVLLIFYLHLDLVEHIPLGRAFTKSSILNRKSLDGLVCNSECDSQSVIVSFEVFKPKGLT